MLPVIRTNDGFTTVVNGKAYTVSKTHKKYALLLKSVRESNAKLFVDNFNLKEHKVDVDANGMFLDGVKLHDVLARRTVEMFNEGFDVEHMRKFLKNVLDNPSEDSRKELYEFLEHKLLPITTDGCFLAYKVVKNDFWSKTAGSLKLTKGQVGNGGRIYNGVGQVIECKREDVDSDRSHECSNGLHVGAFAYAGPGGSFYSNGDRVVVVKVNPKDVVSVPRDYNATKVRVCAYTVVEEYKLELNNPVYNPDMTKVVSKNDYIDPNDVVECDVITFKYVDRNGNKSTRENMLVEEVYPDRVVCIVNNDDYENGEEPVYKSFLTKGMSEVVVE